MIAPAAGLARSVRPGGEGGAPLLFQLPDLKITSLYLSGSNITNDRCLNVVLTNNGTADAYNVGVQVKQKHLGIPDGITRSYPAQASVIHPGQSVTVTYNISATFGRLDEPGNMVYTATVDYRNLIAESNENNNTAQVYS
jgi:hypothetical protein